MKKLIALLLSAALCLSLLAGCGSKTANNDAPDAGNSGELREEVCEGLEFLGIELDKELNAKTRGEEKLISTGKTEVWIIPTNEELLIARDTKEIIEK